MNANAMIRRVDERDVSELRRLHDECFPIKYGDDYIEMLAANGSKKQRMKVARRHSKLGKLKHSTLYLCRAKNDDLLVHCCTSSPIQQSDSVLLSEANSRVIVNDDATSSSLLAVVGAHCRSSIFDEESESLVRTEWFGEPIRVAYIMTLGVREHARRRGLASKLVAHVFGEIRQRRHDVKAVYLHVLRSNVAAQQLYSGLGFQAVALLDNFYHFDGREHDALLFVCYVNGGQPPLSWSEWAASMLSWCWST
jgi:ribosomal protein S18 acetylase RimI-like enzyme